MKCLCLSRQQLLASSSSSSDEVQHRQTSALEPGRDDSKGRAAARRIPLSACRDVNSETWTSVLKDGSLCRCDEGDSVQRCVVCK